MSTPNQRTQIYGGDHFVENLDVGELSGMRVVGLPAVASVGAGVANTVVQARHVEPFRHRRRKLHVSCSLATAVGGTAPTVDVFATLPAPTLAPTLSLVAEAGDVGNGAHLVAIAFRNAAGKTTIGPTATITVANKTAAGKILVSNIECGEDGTTHRDVYMSEAAGTEMKLAGTVTGNAAGATITLNVADVALGATAVIVNGTGVTILDDPISLTGADVVFSADILDGGLPLVYHAPGVLYTARAVTGASTGAIANLQVTLDLERIPLNA